MEVDRSAKSKGHFGTGLDLALQGIVGGAAWWLVGAAAVVVAGFLKGTIPAGPAIIVFLVVLGVSASISTALMRRAERAEGERDEAQRQAATDRQRALEIQDQADVEKRELREQLAAATGGQQVVSTRMQSIARQVDALASVEPALPYGPDSGQIGLLVVLLEDFDQKHPNDPVVQGLLKDWVHAEANDNAGAWHSALKVLKARAVSLGAEESFGQET